MSYYIKVMSYYLVPLKSMHINTNKAQNINFQSHDISSISLYFLLTLLAYYSY
jgi:hypothetical protein